MAKETDPASLTLAQSLVQQTRPIVAEALRKRRRFAAAAAGLAIAALTVLIVQGLGAIQLGWAPAAILSSTVGVASVGLGVRSWAMGSSISTSSGIKKRLGGSLESGFEGAGMFHLSIAVVSTERGDVLIDTSGVFPKETLVFQMPVSVDAVRSLVEEERAVLEHLPSILAREPLYESTTSEGKSQSVHDIEARLLKIGDELIRCLDGAEKHEESLSFATACRSLCSGDAEEPAPSEWPILDTQPYDAIEESVLRIMGNLRSTSAHKQWDSLADELGKHLAAVQRFLDKLAPPREKALTKAIPLYHLNVNSMADAVSFNFYCPDCNSGFVELIPDLSANFTGEATPSPRLDPASRLAYDHQNDHWACPLCGKETRSPVAVHRVLDELLLPTFDLLLQENRVERLRIYNDILNQKLDYQNQWDAEAEEAFRQNRSACQAIESKVRDIRVKLATAEASLREFRDLINHIEALRERRLSQMRWTPSLGQDRDNVKVGSCCPQGVGCQGFYHTLSDGFHPD